MKKKKKKVLKEEELKSKCLNFVPKYLFNSIIFIVITYSNIKNIMNKLYYFCIFVLKRIILY